MTAQKWILHLRSVRSVVTAGLSPWRLLGCVVLMIVLAIPVSAVAQAGLNSVGVNTHIPLPKTLNVVKELGAQWVRMDNNWHHHRYACSNAIAFQPALDTAVKHAMQNGLYVYMTLSYTAPCGSLGGRDSRGFNDVPHAHLFANYVRQAVRHYRALGVRHFGLWNEPNGSGFFGGTADQFVENVLAPGFMAIRQGCRQAGRNDCLVLGPELSHTGDYHKFLEHILRRMRSLSLMFDIFTHHIYGAVTTSIYARDSFVNKLDDQRFSYTRPSFIDVLNKVGLAPNRIPVRKVWITETGYRTRPATHPNEMRKQADRIQEILNVQVARDWYANTFFYEIVDPVHPAAGYGITKWNRDGSFFLKDAYLDLQDRLATDPRFFPQGPGGYRPAETTHCTKLGRNGFFSFLPDQDQYDFRGYAGELVSIRLNRDPGGRHKGNRATLILEGHGLLNISRGVLMNDITVTLPASGRYFVIVSEQADFEKGSRFRGNYCVSLESSDLAFSTFARD